MSRRIELLKTAQDAAAGQLYREGLDPWKNHVWLASQTVLEQWIMTEHVHRHVCPHCRHETELCDCGIPESRERLCYACELTARYGDEPDEGEPDEC